MGMANIDALIAEIAMIKESLRIKNQSLANINPNYEANKAYIDRLKSEVAALNASLAAAEAKLKSDSTPPRIKNGPNGESNPSGSSGDGVVIPGGYQAIYDANKDQIKNPNLIYPGQVLKLPDPPGGTYTVASGDTLSSIAAGNGKGTYSTNNTAASGAEARVGPTTAQENSQIAQAVQKPPVQYPPPPDYRVRISLAPNASYLYNAGSPPGSAAGILAPLKRTNGVIFPYTPSISLTYAAHYDPQELTHSNYKSYAYKNSSVDQISITADFTCQTTAEANYLLAVIHFFRSASKMFYGKDEDPIRGTPPPLLYLSGYGAYQFDNHPMALTSFTYSLPTDVDYISASITTDSVGSSTLATLSPNTELSNAQDGSKKQNIFDKIKTGLQRLTGSGLQPGGKPGAPVFTSSATIKDATRVPTKIQIQLSFIPIMARATISNKFSLKDYATGNLLRGSKNAGSGGGMW